MASKYYTKEALDQYAILHPVKIIDFSNEARIGWLVKEEGKYLLLPFNTIFHIYVYARTHIKEIYHLTNGIKIPKEVLDN